MKKTLLFLLFICCAFGMLSANGGEETAASSNAKELTIWEVLGANAAVSVSGLGETPLYKEAMKRTGFDITWIHPPQGQENENFNLMIASNELPDIIFRDWRRSYPGGPEKAISDEIIIAHNDVVASSAPNYQAYLDATPLSSKQVRTDAGTLYGFNFFRADDFLKVFFGPQLRGDWLEELGLDVPETMDDWTNVLKAFKESGKCEYPLGFTKIGKGRSIQDPQSFGAFVQAFSTSWDFYVNDSGEMAFGPMDPQFKDYLAYFKDWYDMGLIDPEFISCERKAFDAKILNGDLGAWVSFTGSGIGAYMDAKRGSGESFNIVPAPYPVLKKGDTPFHGQKDLGGKPNAMSITTQAKNPELAAEWLDYGYSDEGIILFNFGIEGESFEWVTDYPGFEGKKFPKYTELMTNNPDGKTLSQMGFIYTRAFYNGPTVQQPEYMHQYASRQTQKDAIEIWGQTDADKHMVPAITATPEESDDLATIMAEINTYREEMVIKFITGQESLSNFDAFQERLVQMGIERATEIKQAGLERFNAR